jgi:hypothetical protein
MLQNYVDGITDVEGHDVFENEGVERNGDVI